MYKLLYQVTLIIFLLYANNIEAACTLKNPTPTFSLGGETLLIDKNSISQQTSKLTIPNPLNFPIVFSNCGKVMVESYFKMTSDDISMSDTLQLPTTSGTRTFFKITSPFTSEPSGNKEAPQVYISFSVADPASSKDIVITDNSEHLLVRKKLLSVGFKLGHIFIYVVINKNTVAGTYTIGRAKIGELTTTVNNIRSTAANIDINPFVSFTVKESTCSLTSKSVQVNLPKITTEYFNKKGEIKGTTSFDIKLFCSNDPAGTSFNASITDNNSLTTKNNSGILTNSISETNNGSNAQIILMDSQGNPIPISSSNSKNIFPFGSLSSAKTVTKKFKASYYSTSYPVTPGYIKSVANINIDYN